MNGWTKAAIILANVGAINWGLATLGFNIVDVILGTGVLSQIVYYLIALCGIVGLVKAFK